MAHTITGIDVGASSIKFVLVEVGFRQSRLLSSFEEPVPAGEAPLDERQGEALQAGLARMPPETTAYVAVPGDNLAVRVLDLPFSDPRKIEQVVAYELEGQIVHALSDVVYDHLLLKNRANPQGATVLAVAARIDQLGDHLAMLRARGAEPRSLFAAPVVYQALFTPAARAQEAPAPGCRMLLDLGARRTNVCFLNGGETIYARTLARGGETLTAAIAAASGFAWEDAEEAKRIDGFVASEARPAATPAQARMDAVLKPALAPLLRDLRQTIASFRARDKTPIEAILLAGGGAGLVGLGEFLEQELEAPVVPWAPEGSDLLDPSPDATHGRFALATAVAWAGARGDRQIDLRRGPFVYKANFSVLRQKAVHLGALGAALLVCAVIDGSMSLARLNKQRDQLQAQLRTATQELFGQPRSDAKAVATLLNRGFKEEMAPIPQATAFDLLDEISRKIPPADRIKLDLAELVIEPKKASMRGTIDSAAAVDELVAALKTIECFEEISKGPITESNGAKQFTLTIASKCP